MSFDKASFNWLCVSHVGYFIGDFNTGGNGSFDHDNSSLCIFRVCAASVKLLHLKCKEQSLFT